MGFNPIALYQSSGRTARITKDGKTEVWNGDPLLLLQRFLNSLGFSSPGHRPPSSYVPFAGGVVGYMSYDLKNWMDGFTSKKGYVPLYPEISFMFVDPFICIDGRRHAWAVAKDRPGLTRLLNRLGRLDKRNERATHTIESCVMKEPWKAMDEQTYREKVLKIKEYLAAGDVYQVNLTYPISFPFHGDPFSLYCALRDRSCAPMSAYIDFGDMAILSASPERFFRVTPEAQERRIETWPMKGTRPRGRNILEDKALREELGKSPKDRAENLMIVDLMRNDLGKVCQWGECTCRRSVHREELRDSAPDGIKSLRPPQGRCGGP